MVLDDGQLAQLLSRFGEPAFATGETSAEHPVFRRHPISGRTSVYMSTPARCAAVSGLDADEADEADEVLVGLPLEEYAVHPEVKPIRLHEDKIRTGDDGGPGLVAKDAEHAWIVDADDPLTAVVHETARACHRALADEYEPFGCRDSKTEHAWCTRTRSDRLSEGALR